MSDFANYIRVAIQGLPENTPLARARAYKKIRNVIFAETIPVSPAGKVLKKELRKGLNKGGVVSE